jgi:hypothetical protein
MYPRSVDLLLLVASAAAAAFSIVDAHGVVSVPIQRGAICNNRFNPNKEALCNDEPVDGLAPFSGADKDRVEAAMNGKEWVEYAPLEKKFPWRAGVCGDYIDKGEPQDHVEGGQYYGGGKVIQNYTQGQTVQFQVDIYGHHNGFMEWFICDLDACGTDISTNCFADGYCQQLMRAPDAECDSGKEKYGCLPIDLSYPGRWYLPCPLSENNLEMYYDKIYYKLPEKLVCEHCVIQWYWACDVQLHTTWSCRLLHGA